MAQSGGTRRKTIPVTVRKAVMEEFERNGRVCSICGEYVAQGVDIHIDHTLPVSRGGTNDVANLYVAHASCNLSKGKRTDEEYDEVRSAREAYADSLGEFAALDDGPANSSHSFAMLYPEHHVYTFMRRNWRWSVACSCGAMPEQGAYSYQIDAVEAAMLHDTQAWAVLRDLEDKYLSCTLQWLDMLYALKGDEGERLPPNPLPYEEHEIYPLMAKAPGPYGLPTERWVLRCVCGWHGIVPFEEGIDAAKQMHWDSLMLFTEEPEESAE